MILNLEQTARLKTAIDSENSFFGWLKLDTTNISNSTYNSIKSDFEAWQDAYAVEDLYITTGSGTQQVEGIDSVPIPPTR